MIHNCSETKCHHANGSARQALSPSVRSGTHTSSPDAQSQVLMAPQAGHPHTAEALFAMFCLGATVATLALPIETKGRALQVVS